MTEPLETPSPETRDEPAAEPPPEPARKRDFLPALYAAGFLILALAIFWVWRNPAIQPDTEVGALAQQLGALEARIARLEQRPTPSPPDLGPLTARVAALEQRPPPASQPGAPPDLAPLNARVAALEQRREPDLARLEARVATLEAQKPTDTQLAARVDALSARLDTLDTGQHSAQTEFGRRMDADEARLAAIERSVSQVSALVDRANRLARIQAAQIALDRGQALGNVSGAPATLQHYATTKPPTEAALRLAFPAAARAALAAARPSTEGKPILTRLWAKAQDLVTIREGDRVVVGDPAAGVLDRARTALDAGDLAGAVAAVALLSGPAADAMAGWLAQARALLDARAALADWAAHG